MDLRIGLIIFLIFYLIILNVAVYGEIVIVLGLKKETGLDTQKILERKNKFQFIFFVLIFIFKKIILIYFKVFYFIFFNSIYTCHDFTGPTSMCVRLR